MYSGFCSNHPIIVYYLEILIFFIGFLMKEVFIYVFFDLEHGFLDEEYTQASLFGCSGT